MRTTIVIILLTTLSGCLCSRQLLDPFDPLLPPPYYPEHLGEQEIGHRVPGDYMIGSEVVWAGSKIRQTLRFNRTLQGVPGSVISMVRLIDRDSEGFGALANVTEGGPGKDSVTVDFTSQPGHGVYYIAELFGKIESCPS